MKATHICVDSSVKKSWNSVQLMVFCDFEKKEDSSAVEVLNVQLARKEREVQKVKEAAEELTLLRQQNFLLQSKVHTTQEL